MKIRTMVLFVALFCTNDAASPVSYVPPPDTMGAIYEESLRPLRLPELPQGLAEHFKSCLNRPCLSDDRTLFVAAETAQLYAATLSSALQQQYRDEGNGDPGVRADVFELIRDLQNVQVTIHRVRMRAAEKLQSRH